MDKKNKQNTFLTKSIILMLKMSKVNESQVSYEVKYTNKCLTNKLS